MEDIMEEAKRLLRAALCRYRVEDVGSYCEAMPVLARHGYYRDRWWPFFAIHDYSIDGGDDDDVSLLQIDGCFRNEMVPSYEERHASPEAARAEMRRVMDLLHIVEVADG